MRLLFGYSNQRFHWKVKISHAFEPQFLANKTCTVHVQRKEEREQASEEGQLDAHVEYNFFECKIHSNVFLRFSVEIQSEFSLRIHKYNPNMCTIIIIFVFHSVYLITSASPYTYYTVCIYTKYTVYSIPISLAGAHILHLLALVISMSRRKTQFINTHCGY